MVDCIFCKIVRGEIPSHKVYEDDIFLCFLDIRPLTMGNTLIIPKKHYRWVLDVDDFGKYFEVAKTIGVATQRAFKAEWICFLTLGLEIPHAHIRVIPRYTSDLHEELVDLNKFEDFSQEEMEKMASKLRVELKELA